MMEFVNKVFESLTEEEKKKVVKSVKNIILDRIELKEKVIKNLKEKAMYTMEDVELIKTILND